ncbi:hypothetical protein MMC31_002110 [Peltigera leucophlebia]|nr:hypothetical protein [Peltigera leucophlebia]
MDLLPERPSQPQTPGKRALGSDSFVEFKNHSQPETDDAFQAWILSLFNWEIDAICDPKRHNSPRVSNPLDKEKPLPDWQPQDGNFSRSARALLVDSEGILRAECQMLDGEYQFSMLSLKSIIMGLNGEFHWLDGTVRSPSCPISNSSDWHFVSGCKVEADRLPPELNGFWVLAECMDDGGEYHISCLTLDDGISNDNGRLKLITPLGLLTIPLFTDYHVSTIAIAMVIGIQYRGPVQSEDIEFQVQNFLRSQCFAQSSKLPLAESLDAKAATLISLMWIRFCREYTVCNLIMYRDICKAIDDRLRDQPPPSHELKVMLEHYRVMPSHLKRQAFASVQGAKDTRQMFFIREAIHTLQMLLEVITEDDEWKPTFGENLCQMILFRYKATSNCDDLRTACALAETFCTTHSKDGNLKASALVILAECKWEEDKLSSEQKNRKAIVDALKEAESCSTGLNQHVARQNLCFYHIENIATFETFDHAELYRNLELLDVAPTDIAAEGEEVPPLVEIVRWRYKAQGLSLAFQANPEDLSLINKAIECADRSSSAFKTARAKYALSDEIFALSLTAHAQALAQRDAYDDLNRIIEIYQEGLAICRSLSRGRAEILHGLAFHQLLWHERKVALEIVGNVQSSADQLLIDAFQNAEAAYQSPWKYSDAYGLYAHTFIRAWELCFGASGDWSFLDEAIQIAEDSHTEFLHKNRARTNLETTKCRLLFQRYLLRRSPGSYDEAMDAARRHSQREDLKAIDAQQVFEIMYFAMAAFKMKVDLPVGDVAFVTQQCDQILNLDCAHVRDRIEAGKILGELWLASKEWVGASKAYEKTISLFKRLITRSLSRADQEWLLKRFSTGLPTLASFAALYAAEATGSSAEEVVLSALQHLESSRGILARLVFQSRLNVELFRSEDENAAKEYDSLLKQLTLLEPVPIIGNLTLSSNDNLRRANVIQRRAEIVERLSELEDRFEAKTEDISVDVLKSLVGKSAFVQVIANSDTSIALLVTGTELRMIELQELKALDIEKNLDRLYGNSRLSKAEPLQVGKAGQELGKILKWLWDKAVKPILSELGYYPKSKRRHSNQLPRLWWCASNITSKLPFHAAGEGVQSVNSENVYDYAVCSVTVSLTTLRMARGFTAPSEKILNDGMLAVSMPTTPEPGWPSLNAEKELRSIKDAAGIIPTYLTNPRKVDVVERLSEHGIIHFICHGTSIAEDPSSSALILGHQEASAAERLTVMELGNIDFGKAQIAYLSACSTAENSSYKLSEESIHLASAFQLAGFSHVIAAFWEAKDRGAIPLAGLFYQNLAGAVTELNEFESNHDVVAYAFHNALCKVRQNKSTRNPLCWAPFVHIGA